MKRPAIIAVMMALVLATTVSGCGRRSKATVTTQTQTEIRTTTTGQELIDLQKAYESSAITEKEYQKQRKKILERE